MHIMQTALERWQELHDVRARQMDAAYARLGRTSADFWDRRARHYHRATSDTISTDPLYQHLQHVVTPQTTVLDVGAGTGRFSLALAPQAKHVTAVEPSASMLSFLQQDVEAKGLSNVSYVPMTWQAAPDDLSADIVICSHVLYPIRDVEAFLRKLSVATHQTCYIYMRATHLDAITSPIWEHFHGEKRCLSPEYIHALDVLYEMGIYADVTVVHLAQSLRYMSLDNAVEELGEQLILPSDPQTRSELRTLLEGWLVERDGMLVPPVAELACGIIQMHRH